MALVLHVVNQVPPVQPPGRRAVGEATSVVRVTEDSGCTRANSGSDDTNPAAVLSLAQKYTATTYLMDLREAARGHRDTKEDIQPSNPISCD